MALQLGARPQDMVVWLTPGGRFSAVLRQYDGPDTATRQPVTWTTPPVLEFPGSGLDSWVSTVAGNEASFTSSPAVVDALLAAESNAAVLRVGDVVWGRGKWRVGVLRD